LRIILIHCRRTGPGHPSRLPNRSSGTADRSLDGL